MPERVLLDNDVVLKAASYALVDETLAVTTVENTPPAMLGVGRFVIGNRLSRATSILDTARATEAFKRMLAALTLIEPDE